MSGSVPDAVERINFIARAQAHGGYIHAPGLVLFECLDGCLHRSRYCHGRRSCSALADNVLGWDLDDVLGAVHTDLADVLADGNGVEIGVRVGNDLEGRVGVFLLRIEPV